MAYPEKHIRPLPDVDVTSEADDEANVPEPAVVPLPSPKADGDGSKPERPARSVRPGRHEGEILRDETGRILDPNSLEAALFRLRRSGEMSRLTAANTEQPAHDLFAANAGRQPDDPGIQADEEMPWQPALQVPMPPERSNALYYAAAAVLAMSVASGAAFYGLGTHSPGRDATTDAADVTLAIGRSGPALAPKIVARAPESADEAPKTVSDASKTISDAVKMTAPAGAPMPAIADEAPKPVAALGPEAIPQAAHSETLPEAFSVAPVHGTAGEAVVLAITVPLATLGPDAYVVVRGLPKDTELSAGTRLANGWRVSMPELKHLTLTPPKAFSGTFATEVVLVRGPDSAPMSRFVAAAIDPAPGTAVARDDDGEPNLAAARTARVAEETPAQPGATASLTAPEPEAANGVIGDKAAKVSPAPLERFQKKREPAFRPKTRNRKEREPGFDSAETEKVRATSLSPQIEATWLKRGNQMLENGDLAGARLAFEHVATLGSARAAMALGETYDPAVMRKLHVVGLQPDLDTAAHWYRRAAELGLNEAGSRLESVEASLSKREAN